MAQDTADVTAPAQRYRAESLTSPPVQLELQPVQLGAYQVHERLGTGGQACVYRACRIGDRDAGDVALKRLHPHLSNDQAAIQSFCREAHIAYLIDHPVIRRVYALCRTPGELFMTMEYVAGVSLYAVLKRASEQSARLPVPGILAVLHRLCGALHYAHELVDEHGAPARFVHRDISPSNLIVSASGRLKLIDLGVASTQIGDHETNPGLVKGKYGYMAPEVLLNTPFDRRADVFSAGVVAWELLTLRRLFPVRNPPIDLERVRNRELEPPSRYNPFCPPAIDAIVMRALAADPAVRWPTCAAMADALQVVATRLGASLTDAAIAELVDARDGSRPGGRSRFARGTTPALHPPQVAIDGATTATAPVAPAAQMAMRWHGAIVAGGVGGVLASLVTVAVAGVLGWPTAPGAPAAPAIATATPATAPAATAPATAGSAAAAPPAGPTPPPAPRAAMAMASLPVAATVPPAPAPALPSPADQARADAASPAAQPATTTWAVPPVEASPRALPDARAPLEVRAGDVTRIGGPWPRSRSGEYPYRARLCVDAHGAVYSVIVREGPKRLETRIAHAVLRWRYQPYRVAGAPHPVCFELDSVVAKIEREALRAPTPGAAHVATRPTARPRSS
jgi:serine/threonine-protein kinase